MIALADSTTWSPEATVHVCKEIRYRMLVSLGHWGSGSLCSYCSVPCRCSPSISANCSRKPLLRYETVDPQASEIPEFITCDGKGLKLQRKCAGEELQDAGGTGHWGSGRLCSDCFRPCRCAAPLAAHHIRSS